MNPFLSKIAPLTLVCSLLAACGSSYVDDPALAPVSLASLQGGSDATPAALAAAALARPPVDGLAEAYRSDAGNRPLVATGDAADGAPPAAASQP